jgi:hypothetical protein
MSKLVIPLDVSQVPEADRGQQQVKVAAQVGDKVISQVVSVKDGKAEITLDVDPKQAVAIAIGPDTAADDEIFNFQTLTSRVTPAQWEGKASLTLSPIIVTAPWWILWRSWCRTFVIQGRVICPDGSPVPGAEVRAYDVDFFWWWSSVAQVGSPVITDASGHFAMKFRWCCGWWPWWWWRLRTWSLNSQLIEKIYPILKLRPDIKFREPSPVPTVDMVNLTANVGGRPLPAVLGTGGAITDPSVLPGLRDRLVSVLPRVPELERLRIWPWFPWTPWLDCTPDIIFKVTQNCGGQQTKVIVSENVFQTRWDIPTTLNVKLIANQDACCLPNNPPPPPGDCVVFTDVCGIPIPQIGGNAGAPAPVGYVNPGGRDRPFSEVINFTGQFGSSAQADYYEIEYTPHGVNFWNPVPSSALQGFGRGYFDATQPWPNQWFGAGFPLIPLGTHNVYESRHHYEVTHPPANWDSAFGRIWTSNRDLIASIQTANNFPDGTYDFRIIGYRANAAGDADPATRKVMDGCGGNQNNLVAIRIDNRIASPTPGSVHINTTEPDCGIETVRLGGVVVAACGAHKLQPNTPLEIDFFASDKPIAGSPPGPDTNGHLDHYELWVKWDLGSVKYLLDSTQVGAFSLTPLDPGVQVGPDYSNTTAQGGVHPTWVGGRMRLHISDASRVFPKTCCYLIELTVRKRNIVNCDGNLVYYNQMHYTFTVTV